MSAKQPDTSKAAKIQADASTKAAEIQAQAQKEALAQQQGQYDTSLKYLNEQDIYNKSITQQNQANYQPYIGAGQQALGSLTSATQDPNSWLNKTFGQQDLTQDDGYQFRLSQGQDAVNSSLAAKGGLLSGAAVKATTAFNQGMASDEYNNAYQRFTNDRNNRYAQLNNLVGTGLAGASGFAGGSPASTTGTQMSNVAGQYGNTVSGIIQNGANAQSNIGLANAQQQAQYALGSQSGANPLMGALGGAATGAKIGSAVPGIGTAFGALGGAVIGGLSSLL